MDVIDDQGVVRWHVTEDNWDSITLKNLKESIEAGLIAGNLSEIHIILSHPFGNGFFIDWPSFLSQLSSIIDWAMRAGFIAAVAAAGAKVIRECYQKWQNRGANPQDIYRYIAGKQSWDFRDLAKRLDMKESRKKRVASSLFTVLSFQQLSLAVLLYLVRDEPRRYICFLHCFESEV